MLRLFLVNKRRSQILNYMRMSNQSLQYADFLQNIPFGVLIDRQQSLQQKKKRSLKQRKSFIVSGGLLSVRSPSRWLCPVRRTQPQIPLHRHKQL